MATNILPFSLACQTNLSLKPIWETLSIKALEIRILRASMALDNLRSAPKPENQHELLHQIMTEATQLMNALGTACTLHGIEVPVGYTTEDVCDVYTWST